MKIFDWLERRIWPWSELGRLRRWKAEQMAVESSWDAQAVGTELGVVWGQAIRPQILPAILKLKIDLAAAYVGWNGKESRHEKEWLMQAAVFAGVDFGYLDQQVQDGLRPSNDALQCARECYRRGMGYREFPEFLKTYRGQDSRRCR